MHHAEGLNPTYQPLRDDQAEAFVMATMIELNGEDSDAVKGMVDAQFLTQVLDKRIEAMKLPISFSTGGKLAALALVDRPGSMVALLIDCLNKYEGKTVGAAELADLYPTGFYDEATLVRYIDEFLKTKKVKWAEIY